MPSIRNNVTQSGEAAFVGESSQFNGVLGITTSQGHSGVAGVSDSGVGNGIYGRSKNANGVVGYSSATGHNGVAGVNEEGNGNGVYGRSKRASGVYGESVEFNGVLGVTTADGHAGVAGVCDTGNGNGNGVYGRSKAANGVVGYSSSDVHAGVAGANDNSAGVGIYGKGGRLAGLFEGNVEVTGSLIVGGVSVAALLQHIQQLQQQVADLSRRVGSGTGSGGAITQTFINATLELDASASLGAMVESGVWAS
jgi:hypothetical protein